MTFREKIRREDAILTGVRSMGDKLAVAFLVEVVYKNGIVREFWCSEFTKNNEKYTWVPIFSNDGPIYLNADDLSSVWQKDMVVITEYEYRKFPLALSRYKKVFEGE